MLASVPKDLFGGGTGAGISIQPVCFLVVQNGDVRLLQMIEGNGLCFLVRGCVVRRFVRLLLGFHQTADFADDFRQGANKIVCRIAISLGHLEQANISVLYD